jgi:hypothetical protein
LIPGISLQRLLAKKFSYIFLPKRLLNVRRYKVPSTARAPNFVTAELVAALQNAYKCCTLSVA